MVDIGHLGICIVMLPFLMAVISFLSQSKYKNYVAGLGAVVLVGLLRG